MAKPPSDKYPDLSAHVSRVFGTDRKKVSEAPAGFVRGCDIDLSDSRGEILAVDPAGRVHCIVGYRRDDQPWDLAYYNPSVAMKDRDGRSSHRFVELSGGALSMTSFLRDDGYFRILDDRWVLLPKGSDSGFGVISSKSRELDDELTRAIFGGTWDDIQPVATALAGIIGRKGHEFARQPRLTFSRSGGNRCDLSGCLIPRNFPYLAFADSQYDWGHLSLYGFYRLLAFMCPKHAKSAIYRALMDSGISGETIELLLRGADANVMPLMDQRW